MTDRTQPRKTNDSPIARIRMERGLTQGQLAELMGVHQQVISRWEQGTRNPGARSMFKLAQVLGCQMEDLLYTIK